MFHLVCRHEHQHRWVDKKRGTTYYNKGDVVTNEADVLELNQEKEKFWIRIAAATSPFNPPAE